MVARYRNKLTLSHTQASPSHLKLSAQTAQTCTDKKEPGDERKEKETSLACKRLENLIQIRGRFPQRSMYSADILRGRKFNTPFWLN